MGFGKILGSMSPLYGIASGNGLFGDRDLLGSISPAFGMASGKGLFGGMGGGMMGGFPGLLAGKGGQGQEEPETAPMPPSPMGGAKLISTGTMPAPPPSMAPPTGMFGAQPPQQGNPQEMLMRYRMMMNQGRY